MNYVSVPVSWGEIVDKITILEIKYARLSSKNSLLNVKRELDLLNIVLNSKLGVSKELSQIKDILKGINIELWEIEEKIREKEQSKSFDSEFIDLARSVYFTNDKRSSIKREINRLTNSELIEEKSYSDYR